MAANTKLPPGSKVVVDASFVLARIFPDEKQSKSVISYFDKFAQGKLKFIAPQLLKYEIANALRSAVVQKRLTMGLSKKLMEEFLKLPIIYKKIDFLEILKLATRRKITAYDASYLYLAGSHKIPLLSLDKRLKIL